MDFNVSLLVSHKSLISRGNILTRFINNEIYYFMLILKYVTRYEFISINYYYRLKFMTEKNKHDIYK